MKYMNVSGVQLFVLAVITGTIASLFSSSYALYREYELLPTVVKTPGGECIKVVNYENGHAFNCTDVDVLLRRYRTEYSGG